MVLVKWPTAAKLKSRRWVTVAKQVKKMSPGGGMCRGMGKATQGGNGIVRWGKF